MAGSKGSKKRRDRNHGILAALQHPTRRRILRLLADGRKVSPSALATELDEPLGRVAYHARVLARCGALKAAGERRAGGTTQRFYRRSLDAKWAQGMLEEEDE